MTKCCIIFYIFDDSQRFLDFVVLKQCDSNVNSENDNCDSNFNSNNKNFSFIFRVDGYFMSVFTKWLKVSNIYSKMVLRHFHKKAIPNSCDNSIKAKFILVSPKLEVLDYVWNDRICNLLIERQELEHAMSWLSTLGGAFSALGDSFEKCAKVAGQISIQQFKIAFRLGDPLLVARCRLYMALSLIQLGKLNSAKYVVEEQYKLAKIYKDIKLQNMCKGVWAKLQYIHKEKKINCKKYVL